MRCYSNKGGFPILQRFINNGKFFVLLFFFDRDLAEKARSFCCPHCGARLHQAHFQRKPRGGPPELDTEFGCRFSFCCYQCRKRLTPPSLRFLGRRVYFGAIMVLISAMLGGASPRRRQRLHELCGADTRTLDRWRKWWEETFIRTDCWRALFSRLVFIWDSSFSVPRQLLRIIKGRSLQEKLQGVLHLLLPLTSGEGGRMSTIHRGR